VSREATSGPLLRPCRPLPRRRLGERAQRQQGAFIGQRGSWNRSSFSGYKVIFMPFKDGRPAGEAKDFLTGFIANEQTSEVYGRPVGVAVMRDGSLLVADDAGG